MLNSGIIWVGVLVNLVVGGYYAALTVRTPPTGSNGAPSPNPISWGIWSLSGWIAAAGQIAEGAGVEVALTICVAAIPSVICIASLLGRRRYRDRAPLGRLDLICGALSALTLLIWQLTASGTVAIALSIAVDALAGLPVVRQAYRDPDSDSPSIWLAGLFSGSVTLLAIDEVTFASAAFAIYFVFLNALVVALLLRRRIGAVLHSRRREAPTALRIAMERDAGVYRTGTVRGDSNESMADAAAQAVAFATDALTLEAASEQDQEKPIRAGRTSSSQPNLGARSSRFPGPVQQTVEHAEAIDVVANGSRILVTVRALVSSADVPPVDGASSSYSGTALCEIGAEGDPAPSKWVVVTVLVGRDDRAL